MHFKVKRLRLLALLRSQLRLDLLEHVLEDTIFFKAILENEQHEFGILWKGTRLFHFAGTHSVPTKSQEDPLLANCASCRFVLSKVFRYEAHLGIFDWRYSNPPLPNQSAGT